MSPTSFSAIDDHHLRRALDLARGNLASGDGGPFGALLAEGEQVVATGSNQVLASGDPTAHAEVVAIRNAARVLGRPHLKGLTLYTSCEPCPMCLGAAYWAQIDRILYVLSRDDAARMGFGDDLIYREFARPGPERRIPCIRRILPEGDSLVAEWLDFPGRRTY